jgi:mono/diheme cytochrome c family protein
MIRRSVATVVSAGLALLAFSATAEEFNLGQFEFMNSCAQCHGADGRGEGPLAGYLTERMPDLTTPQRDNGGVFPFARVYEVVDGRVDVGAHGTREMPAWGRRYDRDAPGLLGEMWSPGDRDAFVRGRILALVEYISTLQVD